MYFFVFFWSIIYLEIGISKFLANALFVTFVRYSVFQSGFQRTISTPSIIKGNAKFSRRQFISEERRCSLLADMKVLCDIIKGLFLELLAPTHFNLISKISKRCSVLNSGCWLTGLQVYRLLSSILAHIVPHWSSFFRSLKRKAHFGFQRDSMSTPTHLSWGGENPR